MLELKIVSLNGTAGPVKCDSVHLQMCNNTEGREGGSIGIRKGHIKSLISVDKGKVSAYLDSKEVFSCTTEGGFATVEDDTVTLVTQAFVMRNA